MSVTDELLRDAEDHAARIPPRSSVRGFVDEVEAGRLREVA